jgi:hypothetical protein
MGDSADVGFVLFFCFCCVLCVLCCFAVLTYGSRIPMLRCAAGKIRLGGFVGEEAACATSSYMPVQPGMLVQLQVWLSSPT